MSMPPLRLLIVDGSEDHAGLVLREVQRAFDVVEYRRIDSASAMREALQSRVWDVILDFSLLGFGTLEALEIAQDRAPDMPCIIVSGVIHTGTALEAMRAGVRDYLMKDDLARLAPVIARELEAAEARPEPPRAERASREGEDRYRTVEEASQEGLLVEDAEQRTTFANPLAPLITGESVTGAVVDLRDVTKRLEAEEALRASEERFRSLLDVIPHLTFVLRGDGTFVEFRSGGGTPYLPPEEFIGRRVSDVMPADFSEGAMAAVEAALRTHGVQALEYRLPMEGGPRDFDARFIPTGPDEVVAIARDSTDQIRLEEQLLVAQKSEALGTLVAGVAHEFNNLLTGISGSIELARMEPDDPRWLDGAETATHRAADLLRKLLQMSRREPPTRVAVDLRDITRETVALARQTFDRRVALEIDADDSVPLVSADPGQIEQVLMNLLVNALSAVEERAQSDADPSYRPQISVAVRANTAGTETEADAPPGVVLSVIDNGIGISPDIRTRIFDPFFTTKGVSDGTGLGLSVAYGIVAEHGGSIDVTSSPGRGSTFAVVLPVGIDEAADSPASSPGEGAASLAATGGGEAVLIVDDEPQILAFAERALTTAGYEVVVAADGASALLAVEKQSFRVAVVDVSMPPPDGWDVLTEIRKVAPETKVLMTSGYALEDEVVVRGGHGFIVKPYTIDRLVAAVHAARGM